MSLTILSDVLDGRPQETKTCVEEKVYQFLENAGISFQHINHTNADTIDDCHIIENYIGAKICKNLFLKNSAETQYYLLLMDGDTKFDSKIVSHQINSTRLSFSSPENMLKYLGVEPGSASVMGLINDVNSYIHLLVDSKLLAEEFFCCHPCINTSTLKFRTVDIFDKFVPMTNHLYTVVNL